MRDTQGMEQEWAERAKQQSEGAGSIPDRLNSLSPDSADRILRRAVELHQNSEYDDVPLDRTKLEQIAEELGIGVEFVEQALIEEMSRPEPESDLSITERIFHPDQLSTRSIAIGHEHDVGRNLATWMTKHEGLKSVRGVPDGIEWVKDPSPIAALRSGFKISQGTGALKSVTAVTSQIDRIDDERHVVTLVADMSLSRKIAIGAVSAGAAVGTVAGALVAGATGFGSGILTAFGVFGLSWAISLTGTKAMAHHVRKGLRQAIWGITERDPGIKEPSPAQKFFRFFDELLEIRSEFKR